jgi:hypothetical protein
MRTDRLPVPIYRPGQTAVPHRGGCITCEHFHGEFVAHGAHAVCRRDDRPVVHALRSAAARST